MKFSSAEIALITALAGKAVAVPLDTRDENASAGIRTLQSNVKGPDASRLKPTPSDMPKEQLEFLKKYQPNSEAASDFIGSKQKVDFSDEGLCFKDYPCFSVQRTAVRDLGDGAFPQISAPQMAKFLDEMLAEPSITFDQEANPDVPFVGYKLVKDGYIFQMIAPEGKADSKVIAGMAFDMFKLQAADPESNSIRAVQARTDDKTPAPVALCIFPEKADQVEAFKFCVGDDIKTERNPDQGKKEARDPRFGPTGPAILAPDWEAIFRYNEQVKNSPAPANDENTVQARDPLMPPPDDEGWPAYRRPGGGPLPRPKPIRPGGGPPDLPFHKPGIDDMSGGPSNLDARDPSPKHRGPPSSHSEHRPGGSHGAPPGGGNGGRPDGTDGRRPGSSTSSSGGPGRVTARSFEGEADPSMWRQGWNKINHFFGRPGTGPPNHGPGDHTDPAGPPGGHQGPPGSNGSPNGPPSSNPKDQGPPPSGDSPAAPSEDESEFTIQARDTPVSDYIDDYDYSGETEATLYSGGMQARGLPEYGSMDEPSNGPGSFRSPGINDEEKPWKQQKHPKPLFPHFDEDEPVRNPKSSPMDPNQGQGKLDSREPIRPDGIVDGDQPWKQQKPPKPLFPFIDHGEPMGKPYYKPMGPNHGQGNLDAREAAPIRPGGDRGPPPSIPDRPGKPLFPIDHNDLPSPGRPISFPGHIRPEDTIAARSESQPAENGDGPYIYLGVPSDAPKVRARSIAEEGEDDDDWYTNGPPSWAKTVQARGILPEGETHDGPYIYLGVSPDTPKVRARSVAEEGEDDDDWYANGPPSWAKTVESRGILPEGETHDGPYIYLGVSPDTPKVRARSVAGEGGEDEDDWYTNGPPSWAKTVESRGILPEGETHDGPYIYLGVSPDTPKVRARSVAGEEGEDEDDWYTNGPPSWAKTVESRDIIKDGGEWPWTGRRLEAKIPFSAQNHDESGEGEQHHEKRWAQFIPIAVCAFAKILADAC